MVIQKSAFGSLNCEENIIEIKDCSFNPNLWIARNIDLQKRRPVHWFFKRFIDITASTLGIAVILPFLAMIAILIKLDSKGPIFFKQERTGIYGKKFFIYKFRSMKNNAEKELDAIRNLNETNDKMFKIFKDPRVTKLGRILRRFSLDELPQLLNVIKGEMSLVGPRPALPFEVEKYEDWHYLRFGTLPGLTGMWQVNGRASIKDFNRVVKYDYDYLKKWNLILDFKLLLKTIPVVIFTKGAA